MNGHEVPVDESPAGAFEQLEQKRHRVSLDDDGGPDYGPVRLPEDRYLVLGDNRGNSKDGRYFGLVDRRTLLGRAVGVYFSHGHFTWQTTLSDRSEKFLGCGRKVHEHHPFVVPVLERHQATVGRRLDDRPQVTIAIGDVDEHAPPDRRAIVRLRCEMRRRA